MSISTYHMEIKPLEIAMIDHERVLLWKQWLQRSEQHLGYFCIPSEGRVHYPEEGQNKDEGVTQVDIDEAAILWAYFVTDDGCPRPTLWHNYRAYGTPSNELMDLDEGSIHDKWMQWSHRRIHRPLPDYERGVIFDCGQHDDASYIASIWELFCANGIPNKIEDHDLYDIQQKIFDREEVKIKLIS